MNLAELQQLSDWMRQHGATRVKVEGIELELGPDPTPAPAGDLDPEPEEKCLCGHPVDQHSTAGCLAGCGMDLCAPESPQHPAPEEASET